MISLRVVGLAVGFGGALGGRVEAQQTSNPCLRYEPSEVRLQGRVVFEKHFGSPNFGEDTLHDERVTVPMLVLSSPIATCGDTAEDSGDSQSLSDVTKIQLVVLKEGVSLTTFANRDISAVGRLYVGPTTHYYTDVAMDVQEIHLPNGQAISYRRPRPKPEFDSAACLAATPPPQVSTTRVGDFRLGASFGDLEKSFSYQSEKWMDEDAFMQSLQEGGGPELRHFAGISFKLPCARLSGSQFSASLDGKQPISLWDVMGVGLVLPRGLTFSASWGDLQRAFGPGARLQRMLGTPAVCFDSLPGFEFILRTRKTFRTGWPIDSIPKEATIWTVRIAPSGTAPHNFCSKK